ncbi:hypothetical protein Tco_0722606, partial [Tanacetum coccineum]
LRNPVIKPKFDGNSYNPLNRHKLNALPRRRSDGWMQVKVWQFDTSKTPETVSMRLEFEHPVKTDLSGLMALHTTTITYRAVILPIAAVILTSTVTTVIPESTVATVIPENTVATVILPIRPLHFPAYTTTNTTGQHSSNHWLQYLH